MRPVWSALNRVPASQALHATAEVINTALRGSAKTAAAMLVRLTKNNNDKAAAVLAKLIDANNTNTKAQPAWSNARLW